MNHAAYLLNLLMAVPGLSVEDLKAVQDSASLDALIREAYQIVRSHPSAQTVLSGWMREAHAFLEKRAELESSFIDSSKHLVVEAYNVASTHPSIYTVMHDWTDRTKHFYEGYGQTPVKSKDHGAER